MKSKSTLKRSALLLGLALGLLPCAKPLLALADDDDHPATVENVPPVVTVQTGTLKTMTLHSYVTGYGTVAAAPALGARPAAGAPVAAPSAGVIAKVNVNEGQRVEKGQTLAELNAGTVTYALAEAEFQRQEKLFAQHNTSQKALQAAKAQLDSLRVIAPLAGTVTRLNVAPGQAVDASTVVAELVDLERLAVTTKIPEAQADQVKVGEPVQLDRRPGDASVTATISYVSPIVNANDGTVSAWAALPPNSGLRPGQFVPLKIVVATHTNCLAAPAASVVTDVGGQSVIALVRGDEAVQLPVPTGFRENDWVEIVSPDLKPGDSVVTVGAYGLPQQTKIQIANSPDETPADKSPEAK